MLEQEIKERLGASKQSSIDNNYKIWLQAYHGEPYWLDELPIEDKQSLGLCYTIPSELARLTTIELKTNVDNEELENVYQRIIKDIRKIVEYGLALGGVILKPYIQNGKMEIDISTPDMYVILGYQQFGNINHIAFLDRVVKTNKDKEIFYTRLEEHIINGDEYTINNSAYRSENPNQLGDLINLNSVEEWSQIAPTETFERSQPLFAYFKNPQANNLDLRSNEGISCFARALSLIQDADEQYQRIRWEMQGSELAIHADVTYINAKGEMPKGKQRLYRDLGLESKGDDFYEVFSPSIRDISLYNDLNKILRNIETVCGLAFGTLSESPETAKTATEILMSRQRSYATVTDIQNELEKTLEELIEIIKFWYENIFNIKIGDYEVSFDFDDSLIVDSKTEQEIMLAEVSAGIISKEYYLEQRYGLVDDNITPKSDRTTSPYDDIENE